MDVEDTAPYEDETSDMRVFVNLFIIVVKDGHAIAIIDPSTIEVAELNYLSSSDNFKGTFTIPKTMQFSTLLVTKSISTETIVDRANITRYL